MDSNRRGFLRHSLVVLGSVTTGGAIAKKLIAEDAAKTAPDPNAPITPSLTADHQVVHTCCGNVVPNPGSGHAAGMTETSVREGIAGRKFVMVIDLSKCDGCGKCMQACSKMHFVPPERQW